MTRQNFGNTRAENPGTDAGNGMNPINKAVWSPPTLTRLDGKETQAIAPHGPKGSPARQLPEEMVFFGS